MAVIVVYGIDREVICHIAAVIIPFYIEVDANLDGVDDDLFDLRGCGTDDLAFYQFELFIVENQES